MTLYETLYFELVWLHVISFEVSLIPQLCISIFIIYLPYVYYTKEKKGEKKYIGITWKCMIANLLKFLREKLLKLFLRFDHSAINSSYYLTLQFAYLKGNYHSQIFNVSSKYKLM